jgi:hypothetical protein
MPAYQILRHKDFEKSTRTLAPNTRSKAVWAQVLLGTRGRTPSVKGTMGQNARWLASSNGVATSASNGADSVHTILVHSVRHHDQTDAPIVTGELSDYHPIPIDGLDPRYEEQVAVSRHLLDENISVATLKGLPGSGKTVALLYLLKDLMGQPGDGTILYVTYTPRLKRAASEFIVSQYAGRRDDLLSRVRICTLNEVLRELTGISTYAEPFGEIDEFYRFLDRQNPSDLGLWRKYPRTFFTEIRAHLLGRDFPAQYDWAQENLGEGSVDALTYALDRDIDLEEAEVAYTISNRVKHMRYFRDQVAARQALQMLVDGEKPGWLADLDALVIDEVQDLTLLQIAFLAELSRVRRRSDRARPLTFAVAGDESQIVQPSGFDWGMTKYLLGEQIGIWPEEFEFEYQRRSPENLADLIDNSWVFYSNLPKEVRPSARRRRVLDEAEQTAADKGRIYLCPLPAANSGAENGADSSEFGAPAQDEHWRALLEELTDRPGRALV